ncbi:DNA-3-methyladenine glycosylase [Rothia sp. ZJ1223]|uniref:DNA-3-methyladenine glycosylase family protein n=1 Tax=Rothia sp. ZJ1223 TaxID=2811098 RepID=UPI00195E9B20|nr:3-methyladenine DNA glycosylase [Rothia sp. ZJ1223]MBM7051900.1 3-methyladenine DNA glycosylase [Rothia sp. ZJ1223]
MLRATVILQPPHPIHLGQTLGTLARGHEDPLFRSVHTRNQEQYWVSSTYRNEGVLLCFSREHSTVKDLAQRLMHPITVRLWCHSDASSLEQAAANLPYWLGFHDVWDAFLTLSTYRDLPLVLRETQRNNPGIRLSATGQLTRHMVTAIAEQKVTGIEAMGGMRAIIRELGSPVPATGNPHQPTGMLFFPDARAIRRLPSWKWHRFGFDSARSKAILAYTDRATSLEHLAHTAPVEQLASALNTLPGIGPWTISEALQRSHGHPDAISVGDFHLAHLVGYALTGRRTDDAGMLHLLKPWAGHRARVVALIKASGVLEPRRAPRLAPEDHRFI